jgi:hypothetical protein
MIPKALVTITIKRVTGLSGSLLASSIRPYVLASVGGMAFGRSRLIPKAGGDFDLSREPMHWRQRVSADGNDIPVRVEIWDDRSDDAPVKLAEITGVVPVPYFEMELQVGAGPQLVLDVRSVLVPASVPIASVTAVPDGVHTRSTLRPVDSLVVELTDVLGLYVPVASGVSGRIRAERRPGYTSQDHLGRVYLNHDLTKSWKSGEQQIQLEAKVTATRGRIPADAKIHWRVLDVDDPSNDHPWVHRQWGPYLDATDYDGSGTPTGAAGHDNDGKPSADPPWQEVAGFALASKTKTEATTQIVGNQSKVILLCPSTAGDNFVVTAEVQANPHTETYGTSTGVITMWHRLMVESVRMQSAFALPTDDVPVPFEAAFVELEFAADRVVGDVPKLAPNAHALDSASTAYVNSVFAHKADPGWFCIIAAMEPHPLPALQGATLFPASPGAPNRVTLKDGGGGDRHFEYIEIPGNHPDADFAELGPYEIGFELFSIQPLNTPAGPATRCWIQEHDAQPEFTAGDGSIDHAYAITYSYSPRFRKHAGTAVRGGYGMPNEVAATVFSPGAFYTSGISPSLAVGRTEFFAGRTIVFTHHSHYRDGRTGQPRPTFHNDALQVMVHELVHAFGMPHKCGYFDFRAPRAKTCCMNYSPNWMVDNARNLIPGTSDRVGMDMCGRHLKEVRRVKLHKNGGLHWT